MELFGNLLFLIPVAFVIAIRIIGEQSKRSQNQRRVSRPAESSGSPFPAKAPSSGPAVKKASVKKTVQKKKTPQTGNKPPPQKIEAAPLVKVQTPVQQAGPQRMSARIGELQQKLTPLQMGMIWSEILGPPKAEGD